MMSRIRLLVIVVLSALLAACASGPRLAEIQSQIPNLDPAQGRLYFYRSDSFVGGGVQPNILVNGQVAGKSVPGGFFFVDARPGPVEVSCSTEVEKKLSLVLDAGQTRYVRTVVGMGFFVGRVYPELVDNAEGAKMVAEAKYIGAPLPKR
jgi:hypothetical protein